MLNFVVRDLSKKQQTVFFRGSSPEEATEDIISKQLPEVVRLNAEGALSVENIDVFCEKGVFDVDQVNNNNH
jgi:imidazolonepropionase